MTVNQIKEFLKTWESKNFEKIKTYYKLCIKKIPDNQRYHLINIAVLIGSYLVSSILIYPSFEILRCLKEIFSLLCIYYAIFFWFMDKFSETTILRFCLAVTTCLFPVILAESTFGVSLVCISLIIALEYIIFCYIRGCHLFSKELPVYIICETKQDVEESARLTQKYKVLELISLSGEKGLKLSRINSTDKLDKQLNKISRIPFWPAPRKLIYCAENVQPSKVRQLLGISAKYAVPLFRTSGEGICPISLKNFSPIPSVDKNLLNNVFKNKNIWICFDGRRSVADLICTLAGMNSVNLSVICESEALVAQIEPELTNINGNYSIKVADLPFLLASEVCPDILFYNFPIESEHSFSDESLKNALVRNVVDTLGLIKLANIHKIPMTFVLSSSEAQNANNWTRATQRLGELYFQHADFFHMKTQIKFKVVRLPENIWDINGFYGKALSSILDSGCINENFYENNINNLYDSEEILPLMIKAISMAYKTERNAEVLTVIPQNKANTQDVIKNICNLFGLEPETDINIIHDSKNEAMELDNFPNISESSEKTSEDGIFVTKFIAAAMNSYNKDYSIEEIGKMNQRDLMSMVFQELSEKIKMQG